MANDSFRSTTGNALADLIKQESQRTANTTTAPTPASVRALEERLGEWLPPGSHTTLPAKSSGK